MFTIYFKYFKLFQIISKKVLTYNIIQCIVCISKLCYTMYSIEISTILVNETVLYRAHTANLGHALAAIFRSECMNKNYGKGVIIWYLIPVPPYWMQLY